MRFAKYDLAQWMHFMMTTEVFKSYSNVVPPQFFDESKDAVENYKALYKEHVLIFYES